MGMWIGRKPQGSSHLRIRRNRPRARRSDHQPQRSGHTSFRIPRKDSGPITLKIPIIASAMDGVTDVRFCIEMGKLGGLGVINLEGIQTRYANPAEVLDRIVNADKDHVTTLIQKVDQEPIKEELIGPRVPELKASRRPRRRQFDSAKGRTFRRHRPGEAGADIFVVQSTVSTVKHISTGIQIARTR